MAKATPIHPPWRWREWPRRPRRRNATLALLQYAKPSPGYALQEADSRPAKCAPGDWSQVQRKGAGQGHLSEQPARQREGSDLAPRAGGVITGRWQVCVASRTLEGGSDARLGPGTSTQHALLLASWRATLPSTCSSLRADSSGPRSSRHQRCPAPDRDERLSSTRRSASLQLKRRDSSVRLVWRGSLLTPPDRVSVVSLSRRGSAGRVLMSPRASLGSWSPYGVPGHRS